MKRPRPDLLFIIIALLLATAMALTLWYGRQGQSRHGYGSLSTQHSALSAVYHGPPWRTG